MKKYMITAVASVTLSIVIIVHLYKTTEIQWIDSIVEESTKLLGYTPAIVEQKVRKRALRAEQEKAIPIKLPDVIDTLTVSLSEPKIDSTKIKPEEGKKKRLFNMEVAKTDADQKPILDSSAILPSSAVKPEKPKKKMFNLAVEKEEIKASTPTELNEGGLVYFTAEVNRGQQFVNDQVLTFRTAEPVKIGDSVIPDKFIFTATANVSQGRIYFIVQTINELKVNGENYKDRSRGLPITADVKHAGEYYLSDGYPVVFGVKL